MGKKQFFYLATLGMLLLSSMASASGLSTILAQNISCIELGTAGVSTGECGAPTEGCLLVPGLNTSCLYNTQAQRLLSQVHVVEHVPLATTVPPALGFLETVQPTLVNSLKQGDLQADIYFAQSHTVRGSGGALGDYPDLVTARRALMVVRLINGNPQATSYTLQGSYEGKALGSITLQRPGVLIATDQDVFDGRAMPTFSTTAWTAVIPSAWMYQGLSLTITDNNHSTGTMTADQLTFAPESQLLFFSQKLGLLTSANNLDFSWTDDPLSSAVDFFQKIPVTRVIVSPSQSVILNSLLMPNGAYYDSFSLDVGSIHSGDLRDQIAQGVYGVGAHLANVGVTDSCAASTFHPAITAKSIVQAATGNYSNGTFIHGLSGGNALLMLAYGGKGSEFSHAIGHMFGLVHYDGLALSMHGPESGWGYDALHHKMIGNFLWKADPETISVTVGGTKHSEEPFAELYTYNKDPMAGGYNDGSLSSFSHYTAHSARKIQAYLQRPIPNAQSPTGYAIWDTAANAIVPYNSPYGLPVPHKYGVPVITVVGLLDPGAPPSLQSGIIYPVIPNGYGYVFNLQQVNPARQTTWCALEVTYWDSSVDLIQLHNERYSPGYLNKFHVNLDVSRAPAEAILQCAVSDGTIYRYANIVFPKNINIPQAVIVGSPNEYKEYLADLLSSTEGALKNIYQSPNVSRILSNNLVNDLLVLGDQTNCLSSYAQSAIISNQSIIASMQRMYSFITAPGFEEALIALNPTVYRQFQFFMEDFGFTFPDPSFFNLLPSSSGCCMTMSDDLKTVTCMDCDPTDTHQKWFLDSIGRVHSAKRYDMCLSTSRKGSLVRTSECILEESYQKWTYFNQAFLMQKNLAIELDVSTNTYNMMPYAGSDLQTFVGLEIVKAPLFSLFSGAVLKVMSSLDVNFFNGL